MRTESEIRDRIQMAIVEEMQTINFLRDPENWVSEFLDSLTDKITTITLDEITFRPR